MLEDKNQRVQIFGLTNHEARTPAELQYLFERCWALRRTQQTSQNDTSSRSHCVYTLTIRTDTHVSSLKLVDLAGTEWDTGHYDKERRQESAEINKSLMALKECIRALENPSPKNFIPFRGSKMTLMLRDSFILPTAQVIMFVCVSPALSKMEHTLVTLRYANSIREGQKKFKEHKV